MSAAHGRGGRTQKQPLTKEKLANRLGVGDTVIEKLFVTACASKLTGSTNTRKCISRKGISLNSPSNIAFIIFDYLTKNNEKEISSIQFTNALMAEGLTQIKAENIGASLIYAVEQSEIGTYNRETNKYTPHSMNNKINVIQFSQCITEYFYFKNTEFALMDTNNNGFIKLNDFQKMYQYSNKAIDIIMKAYKINKNDKLKFDDIFPLIPESYEKQAFKAVDKDNNGLINKKEFVQVFKNIGEYYDEKETNSFIDTVVKYMDIKSNQFEFSEFVAIYNFPTNMFSEIDFDNIQVNNKVDKNILIQYLTTTYEFKGDASKKADKILAEYGSNGVLNKEQFVKWSLDTEGGLGTTAAKSVINDENYVNSAVLIGNNGINDGIKLVDNQNKIDFFNFFNASLLVGIFLMVLMMFIKLFFCKKNENRKKYTQCDTDSDSDL